MTLGPFRKDARERLEAATLGDEEATRAIERSRGLELTFVAFVCVLALGPALVWAAIGSAFAVAPLLVLCWLAWLAHRSYAQARTKSAEKPTEARRTWLTDEGIFVDGVLGPAR